MVRTDEPLTALVLGGGGARAAYQVGVLRALSRLRLQHQGPRQRQRAPFQIIVGTSAGAINAAVLACQADRYSLAVERLARVWEQFSADKVYRADSLGVIRSGAQWLTMLSLGWALRRLRRLRPRSLLDNSPLLTLLQQQVPLQRLPQLLAQGHLRALAVTASGYGSGEHVCFYASAQPVEPWLRMQRRALPAELGYPHLMASSAIPFIFPAAQIAHDGLCDWYGDGSMRQTAPLSPAIHLGAQRLLVVGAGQMQLAGARPAAPAQAEPPYPSLAQIAGHALASIFLDALAVDIERMQRINRTLALLPESTRQDTPLRPLESLVITPSQPLDEIAVRHLHTLPAPVRGLLRAVGVHDRSADQLAATLPPGSAPHDAHQRGAALASYLLFEAPFTRELMALGEADVQARADEVLQFFGWRGRPWRPAAPPVVPPAAALDLVLP